LYNNLNTSYFSNKYVHYVEKVVCDSKSSEKWEKLMVTEEIIYKKRMKKFWT